MFELGLDRGVVLKKAVLPLAEMAAAAHIRLSPEELILAALSYFRMFPPVGIALRMRPPNFTQFRCDERRWISINLHCLFSLLARTTDDDSLSIHGDDGEDRIGFVFFDHRTQQVGYSEMEIIGVLHNPSLMEGGITNYVYKVIVGIPAKEFRRIMIHLHFFGIAVYARITDTKVMFSAMNEEVVLTKEECIIGGAVSENPVTAVFSLHYYSAILNASHLTSTVWLLRSRDSTAPYCMLNFPVGGLGNLMFHFPSMW